MTTMVVRSGRIVEAWNCFTSFKVTVPTVAGVTSRNTGSPAGNSAISSARDVR